MAMEKILVKEPEKLTEVMKQWNENIWKSDVVDALAEASHPRTEYAYTKGIT